MLFSKGNIFRKNREENREKKKTNNLKMETLENRCLLSVIVGNDPPSSLRYAHSVELDNEQVTVFSETISSYRDRDAYTFTPDHSGLMTISMESTDLYRSPGLDSALKAFNYRRKSIAVNDDIGAGSFNSRIEFYVEAGNNYYIVASGNRTVGNYQLIFDQPDDSSPIWEDIDYSNGFRHADSEALAEITAGSVTVEAGIFPARDQDIFRLTTPYTGKYSLEMKTSQSPLDSYLLLYNSRRRLVAKNDDIAPGNTDSYLEFEAQAGDVFYVRADAWRRSLGTYDLTVTCLTVPEVEAVQSSGEPDGNSQQYVGTLSGMVSVRDVACQTWFLGVAGTDYNGYANSLSGPAADVETMASLAENYFGVESDHSIIISNELSYSAFASGMATLATEVSPEDMVIIYYSGHGDYGNSFFLNDNEQLFLPDNTRISEAVLEDWISNINSEAVKLVVIDSCYSGGFTDIANSVPNTVMITSSAFDQYAWDEVSGYYPDSSLSRGGVFSNWLNYGFSGHADSNRDGYVSIMEAYNYTDLNINIITGTGFSNQDPQINSSIDLDTILARMYS